MLTVEEVRARGISLPTDEDAAYGVIDEMEAWVASRIGPLDGERTETFLLGQPWVFPGWSQRQAMLRLRRPTDAMTVTDNGVDVDDAELRNGRLVASAAGYWNGRVAVTSTPNDALLVRGVLFDLLKLGGTETGYQAETIGSYSYTRAAPQAGGITRWSLIRRLIERQSFDSIPVRGMFDRPWPVPVISSDLVTS